MSKSKNLCLPRQRGLASKWTSNNRRTFRQPYIRMVKGFYFFKKLKRTIRKQSDSLNVLDEAGARILFAKVKVKKPTDSYSDVCL